VRELEAALRAAERTEGSAVEEASPGET